MSQAAKYAVRGRLALQQATAATHNGELTEAIIHIDHYLSGLDRKTKTELLRWFGGKVLPVSARPEERV